MTRTISRQPEQAYVDKDSPFFDTQHSLFLAQDSLADRISKLESRLRWYTILGTLAGAILGGGGLLGAAQWIYKAPLDNTIAKYESATKSLEAVIVVAQRAGDTEAVSRLQADFMSLDTSYREALGVIEDCMRNLALDKPKRSWFENGAKKLSALRDTSPLAPQPLKPKP